MRPETTQNLKTLAHTLSNKERRVGKLKAAIIVKPHRTFPPKGRTTTRLPPLPLVFFFLLMIEKTVYINLNQEQTLQLRGGRQKIQFEEGCAG